MLDRARAILEALASLVPPGEVVIVDRPNAPFQAALRCLGRDDVFACLPQSFARTELEIWGDRGAPGAAMIVGSRRRRLISPRGRRFEVETLDRRFAPLRSCSALQIGSSPDVVGILEGAGALVDKCRPLLILSVCDSQIEAVRTWLAAHAYIVRVDEPSGDGLEGLRGRESHRLLVAACRHASAALASAPHRIKTTRWAALNERPAVWHETITAAELASMNGVTCDRHLGHLVYWTGPSQHATFRLFLPSGGRYEIEVLALESVTRSPDAVTIRVGATEDVKLRRKVDGSVCFSRTFSVSDSEADDGVFIALVTGQSSWSTIENVPRLVGLAVNAMTIRLVDPTNMLLEQSFVN